MANSLDPDKMAHDEPSHRDVHCLHRYWFLSAALKGLSMAMNNSKILLLRPLEIKTTQLFDSRK